MQDNFECIAKRYNLYEKATNGRISSVPQVHEIV